jgi:ankyrin repeat protein
MKLHWNKFIFFCISIVLITFISSAKLYSLEKILFGDSDSLQYISNDNEYNFVVAALKGDYQMVESLLNSGMNPNIIIDESITALAYAAQSGNLKICELLVSKGADVNLVPRLGKPAIVASVKSGHPEVFDFLVNKGADINLTDDIHRTALIYASAYGDTVICEKLLQLKANTMLKDMDGFDAFLAAIINNQFSTAQLLLNAGLNVNSTDKNNVSGIMIATGNNDTHSIDWLLEHGADINNISKHHQTALTLAIEKKDETLIQYLIDHGANVNQKLTFAETPMTIARYYQDDEFIIEALQTKGATQNIFPDFRMVTFGPEISWNFNDFMIGLSAGVKEYKYKFDINGGILFRPFSIRVLSHDSAQYYHQYWERRNYAYLEIQKHFDIFNPNKIINSGISIGLQGIYTFGDYRGTSVYIPVKYILVPEIGVYQTTKHFQFGIKYKYIKFATTEVSPSRIDLTFKVIIGSLFDFDKANYKPWE